MDALVLIAVGALVLVASLRFDSTVGRGWRCAGAVGAVICLFLGIRAILPDETVFFASEVARRVRGQVAEFQKSNARDFVVVEGSSVAAHGCDPKILREEMAKRGVDVGVLQFSAQGANHFERAFFMEAFWRRLAPGERERLESGRVVVLREVFDAYDRDPLYLFAKDSYTERAKVYMSPEYAWAAWRAFLAGMPNGISEMEKWRRGLEMGGIVLDRLLLNRFAAGALSGNLRLSSTSSLSGNGLRIQKAADKSKHLGTCAECSDLSAGLQRQGAWPRAALQNTAFVTANEPS